VISPQDDKYDTQMLPIDGARSDTVSTHEDMVHRAAEREAAAFNDHAAHPVATSAFVQFHTPILPLPTSTVTVDGGAVLFRHTYEYGMSAKCWHATVGSMVLVQAPWSVCVCACISPSVVAAAVFSCSCLSRRPYPLST